MLLPLNVCARYNKEASIVTRPSSGNAKNCAAILCVNFIAKLNCCAFLDCQRLGSPARSGEIGGRCNGR